MISIVIPTYNERDGIEEIIASITKVLGDDKQKFEIIIVDDDSPDKTWEFCESIKDRYPLRIVRRIGKKGLSSAVIDGWHAAEGDILGVMDADGSHDAAILPQMIDALNENRCQLAIGSRYIPGGGTKDWPWFRIFTSKTAIMFARPITKIHDATSGFCLFKKEIIDGVELDPIGWKIVLETAVKGRYETYMEFPFVFKDREKGKSKLGRGAIVNYLKHLWSLRSWMRKNKKKRI